MQTITTLPAQAGPQATSTPGTASVQIQHIRNATTKIDYAGKIFLVDPSGEEGRDICAAMPPRHLDRVKAQAPFGTGSAPRPPWRTIRASRR
jgi:hypothetical protein